MLKEYEVQLTGSVQERISKHISFPSKGQDKPEIQLQTIPRPAASRGTLHAGKCLRVCKSVSLKMLKELLNDLSKLLMPIDPYVEALVRFNFHRSGLFIAYKQYVSKLHADTCSEPGIQQLSHLLLETKKLFLKVLDGTATYAEITADGSVDLKSLQVEDELDSMLYFVVKKKDGHGLVALECFRKLFQFPDTLRNILSVCEKFGLTNCKHDPKITALEEVCSEIATDDQKSSLTANRAKQLWQNLEKCLSISLRDIAKMQVLFAKALQNVDFFRFLKEHDYLDENGEQYFHEQIHLITAQLQQEEYDDTVINHLLSAYNYIAVFADSKQSFSMLLESVAALDFDAKSELTQLNTVKTNMHLIQFWFSKAGVSFYVIT